MAYTAIDDPSAHFMAILYTGDGNDNRNITNDANAGDFKPDWMWIKERNSTSGHHWFDSTRGSRYAVLSNTTDAEDDDLDRVQSFLTDGFQLGTAATVNESAKTYVAWQLKANGGTTTTNDASSTGVGSIDSVYQANTAAGFSVVTHTGTGSNGTIAHGLGATPDFIFVKGRSNSTRAWVAWHKIFAGTQAIELSSTDAVATSATSWNSTVPTSTVFSVGTRNETNNTSETYVSYHFAEKQGYSKIGNYLGKGSTDGAFVYTGFKPAFILTKSSSNTSPWLVYDSKRQGYNGGNNYVYAHATNVESSDSPFDILSNGFKFRNEYTDGNGDGRTYIYLAFAESPFVSSEGVPTTAR